jgi:hypothetical protein
VPQADRQPVTLVVDEFHTIQGDDGQHEHRSVAWVGKTRGANHPQ